MSQKGSQANIHFCAISLAISLAVVNVSVFSLFTKAQGR